jgi:hypothetical protein
MTQDEYIKNLNMKFERHFDIKKDITLFGEAVNIYAKHFNISGRTFITKNDIIDRCENNEHCFVKSFDTVTEKEIEDFGQFLKTVAEKLVNPGKDHMSTYITGVIVANNVADNVRETVKNYKYNKAFKFYLHGWCDVRYICVDLGKGEVITNKAGKMVNKVYTLTP